MNLVSPEIEKYIEAHTTGESDVLQQLNRKTQTDVLMPQMLSGKVQGQFLKFISQMVQPERVLEIGTFTGYAAICLAEGLTENGKLFTIDINEELEAIVKTHVEKAGLQNKIIQIIGNAAQEIQQLDETFDLVFIDADKQNYGLYFDLVIDKVRTGGIILADNVLWSGKIINEQKDKDTQKLAEFNDKVQQDNRVENVIVSIRDGIMMIRKK
ncbi:MAG TPA: O-methyltransferase [Chitinophagales bacterium]|jgi:caffeoyl-CoA O-methyltransferase|nr:O-methyltransferase [Chitinophagales bacterium]HPH88290.1 O-methyltransferase [Chitinophagales bacterium]HPN18262.1 O-methyltransferase [Chitinophagales bacterium]